MKDIQKHQIVIIGGGAAGITVASRLMKLRGASALDVAIIEPKGTHYYQPAFTLVGAGVTPLNSTKREMGKVMPSGVTWIKEATVGFDPDQNEVLLGNDQRIAYDYLIVCTGIELNWDKIEGAKEALGLNGVCSNYDQRYVEYTWEILRQLESGAKALFTQAPLPFKCPGAPQKIAYLAADHLSKKGVLHNCELQFFNHGPGIFAVPFFAKELMKVIEKWGIKAHFQHNLVAVDGEKKTATFEVVGGEREGEKVTMEFDMLHMTPPQSPHKFIRESTLVNEAGYVDVNQHSLQHVKYSNIFALGDVGSTPNSKTAAAVRKQAPVVTRNLLRLIDNDHQLEETYDGYASCPLTTSYGKVIMAEFCYGGKVTPTLPLDPSKERWFNMLIKKTGLPIFYWNYMLKGHEKFPGHNTEFQE